MSVVEPTTALRISGVRVDGFAMDEAADLLVRAAGDGIALAVHLVNAYTLSLAAREGAFAALLDRGDLNLPDGTPVAWFGRRAGVEGFDGPVPGPDLTGVVCDRGRSRGVRHYLYGSSPDVVERFAEQLQLRYPGIEIVGVESPPFRPLDAAEESELVTRIKASGAHVVWVGLGTPKQDVFVDAYRDRLGIPLVAVGAAFDFIAGEKKIAPAWMRKRGLEWLFRLLSEPRRLWRRYLVGNIVFLLAAWRRSEVVRAPARPWASPGRDSTS